MLSDTRLLASRPFYGLPASAAEGHNPAYQEAAAPRGRIAGLLGATEGWFWRDPQAIGGSRKKL